MGRKSKSEGLNVWMNGELIGHWKLAAQADQEFRYNPKWFESPYSRPISMSLPLQPSEISHKGDRVKSFFENLLPDSEDIKKRIQMRYAAASTDAFQLLKEIGRDCVGAVQLLPQGENPKNLKSITGEPQTPKSIEKQLQRHLRSGAPFDLDEKAFRFSLAGVQEKAAYLRHQSKWCIPIGATPSTHIFKLPLGQLGNGGYDMTSSVENEWVCLQILTAFGLNTSNCFIKKFGSQKVLVVERFDRKLSPDNNWWMRLPMEDMCQANGISPLIKYENQGGPGIMDIMRFLLGSAQAEEDRIHFFKTQILFWLLAAPDGHAKNFSIFINPRGSFQLTPLYDVISAYPIMGNKARNIHPKKLKMAMYWTGKNRHDRWEHIGKSHILETGKKCGLSEDLVIKIMMDLAEQTPAVLKTVTKKLTADTRVVGDFILRGLLNAVSRLKAS